jgi:hypothetical protein
MIASQGPLSETDKSRSGSAAATALRVEGFGRLPVTDVTGYSEAGVRTAGEFAPAVVSVYQELAPVHALILRFRTGTTAE